VTKVDQRSKGSRVLTTANSSLRRRRATLVLVLAFAASMAVPALASAASFAPVARPEVGIEDEDVVFGSQATTIVPAWRAMGVDSVRIEAYWDALSPNPTSATMPPGFNPANPNDPQYDWTPLDRAIGIVLANGMGVNLTIHNCNPRWASTQPSVATHCWRPSPTLYAQFASAVVRRYNGRIRRVLLGMEPNQRQFLAPQFTCAGRRCTPASPHIYRALVRAAYPAIKAIAPGLQVLIGELAPIGSRPSPNSGMKPLLFFREMGCVDNRFRPIRGGRCAGFKPAVGDAIGYHPYVNNRKSPTFHIKDPDIAKIGDLKKLFITIDSMSRKHRLNPRRGRRFTFYFTEYGYISNPPSGKFGVSLPRQSLYNSQTAYIVWQNRSRIKLLSQYLWFDDATFGTGLLRSNGVPKPALGTFPHPFFIDGTLRKTRFWGQVRPDAQRQIQLQERRRGSATFKTVRTANTDAGGYWTFVMRAHRGSVYRFVYTTATGPVTSATLGAPPR
jgi:hypothetical protein